MDATRLVNILVVFDRQQNLNGVIYRERKEIINSCDSDGNDEMSTMKITRTIGDRLCEEVYVGNLIGNELHYFLSDTKIFPDEDLQNFESEWFDSYEYDW